MKTLDVIVAMRNFSRSFDDYQTVLKKYVGDFSKEAVEAKMKAEKNVFACQKICDDLAEEFFK